MGVEVGVPEVILIYLKIAFRQHTIELFCFVPGNKHWSGGGFDSAGNFSLVEEKEGEKVKIIARYNSGILKCK